MQKIHNEAEVRAKFIDPALKNKGWDFEGSVSLEYSVYKKDYEFSDGRIEFVGGKTRRGSPKKCDYLLFIPKTQTKLAIIEAKSSDKPKSAGLQQAKDYAKDLDVKFVYASNGSGFVEFDFFTGLQRELDEFPTPEELKERYLKGRNASLTTPITKAKDLLESSYFLEKKSPRYYQANAINRTIEAIANGQKRILLVMATGTGKTYTAFQIAYRLYKSGVVKRMLFLADRVNLLAQSVGGDFAYFTNKGLYEIKHRKINRAYSVYFSTYQQLIEGGDEMQKIEYFKDLEPDFFDLIIIDECHRGSAREDSVWRKILEYFDSAIHIGLTATPVSKSEKDNIKYFCAKNLDENNNPTPHFVYSLRQGIEDGFLAPYKVVRFKFNINDETRSKIDEAIDNEGRTKAIIQEGKLTLSESAKDTSDDLIKEKFGDEAVKKAYKNEHFNRVLFIKEHIKLVALKITEFLRDTLKDRYAKTIVFCQSQEHALSLRDELNNLNADLSQKHNGDYVVRITSDEGEVGKNLLSEFIDIGKTLPVIATTSKLLTTGVDSQMVKLIVIAQTIDSVSEFQQIIGRGTRLNRHLEDLGKQYFSILDFTGATELFLHDEFDGIMTGEDFPPQKPRPKKVGKPIIIDGIPVYVVKELQQLLDKDGNLISCDFIKYTQDKLKQYSLKDFLQKWSSAERKNKLLAEFESQGILIDELKALEKFKYLDEFDILLHLGFNQKPISRKERAKNAKKLLTKYKDKARQVIEILLDKYAKNGISELENPNILTLKPFDYIDIKRAIEECFGDVYAYNAMIKDIEREIYKIA